MQIAQPVESFQGQGEAGEQPDEEQTDGMVVAEVFPPIAVFGVVEARVLDLRAALGHRIPTAAADSVAGKVGEPAGLDDDVAGLMLPMPNHPHRRPAQRLPRIKVIRFPRFDAVGTLRELEVGRLGTKASLGGLEKFGQIILEAGDHGPAHFSGGVQKRCRGKFSVHHPVIDEAGPQTLAQASQQALSGGVLAVAWPVRFHIHRQSELPG